MAKTIFRNHDQEKIATALAEMLRQETGAATPLSYKIEDSRTISAGTAMGEILHAALGGERSSIQLFTVHFDLSQPRPLDLRVQVNRQGIGSYAGPLLYTAKLSRPVAGRVNMEQGKNATFSGDPSVTARFSADLVRRIQKLLRVRMQVGAFTVSIRPFFTIIPDGQTSVMAVNTLPRFTTLGLSSTLDAKEVTEIAGLVEAAI